jgi:hypothetical protein
MSDYLFDLKPNLGQQIAELERELVMRRQVYPKLIGAGKLRKKSADWQMAALASAIATLKTIQKEPNA